MVLGQELRDSPNLVKGVVKRGGGGTDDVWFSEIALDAGSLKFREQFLRMFVCQDGELAAPLVRLARRNDRKEA